MNSTAILRYTTLPVLLLALLLGLSGCNALRGAAAGAASAAAMSAVSGRSGDDIMRDAGIGAVGGAAAGFIYDLF